jgi:colanic acid/amylovoran biosynthesis glycosyltransferase
VTALAVFLDRVPELSETFVTGELQALRAQGHAVRVEAIVHAARPNPAAGEGIEAAFVEDEPRGARLRALAALGARHPLRCAHDLVARRRWSREEPVTPLRRLAIRARRLERRGEPYVHAHFAAGAALDAMRIAALTGRRWGFTAHGYEIYATPTNLPEKVRRADLPVSVCDYCVRDLERLGGRPVAKVVMGVDPEAFRRLTPYAGGRRVLAVGRLIEKKGFAHLIEATALLARRAPLERLTIVGEGPLREELSALVRARGLDDTVQLAGARTPDEVRAELETADLLVMPAVVARDGDRDSMPVVVKEALAMEVPVVASAEVGLPEIVHPEWGALAAPGDPAALADAIESVLRRAPAERAAMGRAGREHVIRAANIDTETARLAALIDAL